ncbi:MAG TPA: protein kinase, partial [Pseudomonadota bacterium]|nr:protein kinase [Pseudomonadota bacterium]
SHPGIVRIFDCGYTSQGIAYLAMEYLDGESLRTRIDRERSLAIPDALRIARQIASALQAAHSRQVVHRDLKPDNIMLVSDPEMPGGERVKLLDFGVAKLAETLNAEPMLTRSDMLMGTPTYMAPEQCRGAKHVTDRSDVYSLGVILYQLIAGLPPFTGETVGELIAMHLTDTEPQLAELIPGLDPAIAQLVHAMLRKKPAERPSVEEVAVELKRLLLDVSQAEGLSPGQVRRLVSESAIPLMPLLSPEAQDLVRGNTAPPTIGGIDSGPHPRLSAADRAAAAGAAAGAGSLAAKTGEQVPLKDTKPGAGRREDPALSSTWDGEAVSRHVPAALLSAAAAMSPAALGSASTAPPPAASDPDATPPIAAVHPVALASATTPRNGEPAAPPGSTSLDRAARTMPMPMVSSRRPWPWVVGAIVAGAGLLWLFTRGSAVPPTNGPQPVGQKPVPALAPVGSFGGPALGPSPLGESKVPDLAPAPSTVSALPSPPPAVDAGSAVGGVAVLPGELPGKPPGSAPISPPSPSRSDPPVPPTPGSPSEGKADLKKSATGPDPAQAGALAALRSKQFAEALRLSQSCVDKQPQNHRCWWMLGVAACNAGNSTGGQLAQSRLSALGKSALSREVKEACSSIERGDSAAGMASFSLRLSDEKSEWLNSASRHFEQGHYLQAQQLAEKNLAQDPFEAWPMIGRAACALGDDVKANLSLTKISDKAIKNDVVHYCIGRGFAYNLGNGLLSKRK